MAMGRIILLFAFFTQTLSAPSGCLDSCTYHLSDTHASLVQGGTNLNDHDYSRPGNWTDHNQYETHDGKVHETRGQYAEGSKSVQYYYQKGYSSSYGSTGAASGGLESDQLGGQRTYEKVQLPSSQNHNSGSTYDQSGAASSVTKTSGYNRVQQSQQSSTRINSQNERLEDFGEYGGYSQVSQRAPDVQTTDTHQVTTSPANWRRVNSYNTDDGHGRVFEEEGQYVTGPKKVRYYKKNYTSSYSTSGGVPTNVDSIAVQNLHNELQHKLNKHLNDFQKEFHQASNIAHAASTTHLDSSQSLTQKTVGFHSDDLQTAESDGYRQQMVHQRAPTPTGTVHDYTDQQYKDSTLANTRTHSPYTYPSATSTTYGTENQRAYHSHETYTSQAHPAPQPIYTPNPGYIHVPTITGGYQAGGYQASGYQTGALHNTHSSGHHVVDETSQHATSGMQHAGTAQNQLYTENSQRPYHTSSPSYGTYPTGNRRSQTTEYEEHWSSSSRTGGTLPPADRTASYMHGAGYTERAHYDRDAYNEHRNRYQEQNAYNSHVGHTSESTYDSRASSGLVTGSHNVGQMTHGAADCTAETQQYQQESRYHRKYKRDAHPGFDDTQQRQIEQKDFTQQNEEFGQESQQLQDSTHQQESQLEFGQQTVDNQHPEDLTQQTEGQLEFGQQTHDNQHSQDLTQQTQDQLEFGQQTVNNQHPEDLTQQTEGQLEFGQQIHDNQHSQDLTQQTQDQLEFGQQQTVNNQHPEDLTQQTEGQLEFGQQIHDNQHSQDLTQQTQDQLEFGQQQTVNNQHPEDLTQQTEGQLEFGQQIHDNQHSQDLTQQTQDQLEFGQQTVNNQHPEDLTQQTEGQLEFGQQIHDNQHSQDLTQQTQDQLEFGQQTVNNQHPEDLTQQTEGQLEFGQQIHDNQHSQDLTQQTQDQLEFGQQQTVNNQHPEDLTQQTEGQLEFGQQIHDNQHSQDLTQQTQDQLEFGQQTVNNQYPEDLTQQTEGQLQFGQQTVDNQHPEDLTQQTMSGFEFSQQNIDNQHLKRFAQQTTQFDQQMTNSDDFTQRTRGKLEIGQQTIDDPQFEDLIKQNEQFKQQVAESDDLTQQMNKEFTFDRYPVNDQHLKDLTQQTEQFEQQTADLNDFTQQATNDKLEFGQQTIHNPYCEELLQQIKQLEQHRPRKFEQDQHVTPLNFGQVYSYKNTDDFDSSNEEILRERLFKECFDVWENEEIKRMQVQMTKPVSKPQSRPRYSTVNPSYTDKTDKNTDSLIRTVEIGSEANADNTDEETILRGDISKLEPNRHVSKIEDLQSSRSNGFEKDNTDSLYTRRMHKSNDATVGSQWFCNYDSLSDLTNIEDSSNSYYPHYPFTSQQIERQTKPVEFDQQVAQSESTFGSIDKDSFTSESSQMQHNTYDQQIKSFPETELTQEKSNFDNQFEQNPESNPSKVIPMQPFQYSQQTSQLNEDSSQIRKNNYKPEPRILQAYGGGPYNGIYNDDFYSRVTPNPNAALPPLPGEDSWIIREKPRGRDSMWSVANVRPVENMPRDIDIDATEVINPTTPIIETTTVAQPPPSYWARFRNKVTSTYDKAKQKAKEIFG